MVFPLTVVALAVAVMLGDGCCAFVSISVGAHDTEKAHRGVGNTIVLTLLSSFVITGLYLLFDDEILIAFGGNINEETFRLAKEYFFYITLGIPFYMFGQAMNPVIRSDGSPRFAMLATISGAMANIVLDPIFIFPLGWGMRGAAVATVIGQIITAALSLIYICRMKQLRLTIQSFVPGRRMILRMLSLGVCSLMSQISIVACMAASNNMIYKYVAVDPVFSQVQYSQIPMAVVGIVMKFFQIVISVVVGISAGCIPIVGYNTGAGQKGRNRELLTKLLISEALVGAAAMVLAEFFPKQLIGIFGAAGESILYTQFAVRAFRIYMCAAVFSCINKATFIFLQAMGQALASTLLSLLREIVFGVGFTLLLPVFLGLDGVLFTMPVSELLTFAASATVLSSIYKKLRA